MKERPIPFSPPMIRAVLDDRKTQTRRLVRPQPELKGKLWHWKQTAWCQGGALVSDTAPVDLCPYGVPGDGLWVKERLERGEGDIALYGADGGYACRAEYGSPIKWRWQRDFLPPIFCPREASRITLEITDVRVERLQDISEEDVLAEGFPIAIEYERPSPEAPIDGEWFSMREYWEQLHGEGSWAENPWLWALSFKRVEP